MTDKPLQGAVAFVVDDEMARVLCRTIEQLGGEAIAATSLATARVMLQLLRVDVAVIDVLLTNGEGPDLIRELHALYPKLPCVLISGMLAPIAGYEELECSFLMKPFDQQELATAILDAIEQADTMPPRAGDE